uniref:Uncharacterized protein n=1 Tax=Globisporangium ultimum (strain ATCC 200006 / CBS 805.95 / DAOM BR144) TaxID=431595 RepID=K3WMI6_GLOUD
MVGETNVYDPSLGPPATGQLIRPETPPGDARAKDVRPEKKKERGSARLRQSRRRMRAH